MLLSPFDQTLPVQFSVLCESDRFVRQVVWFRVHGIIWQEFFLGIENVARTFREYHFLD